MGFYAASIIVVAVMAFLIKNGLGLEVNFWPGNRARASHAMSVSLGSHSVRGRYKKRKREGESPAIWALGCVRRVKRIPSESLCIPSCSGTSEAYQTCNYVDGLTVTERKAKGRTNAPTKRLFRAGGARWRKLFDFPQRAIFTWKRGIINGEGGTELQGHDSMRFRLCFHEVPMIRTSKLFNNQIFN